MITLQIDDKMAEKLRFMAESGVFAVETGSVTMHYKGGKLETIKTERYCYAPKSAPQALEFDIMKISPIL